MPVTPMDEYRSLPLPQNYIGPTRKIRRVHIESQAAPTENRPCDLLRHSTTVLDTGHAQTPLCCTKDVRHC